MPEIAPIPGATERQYRDEALRKAEANYVSEVQNAEALKQKSILDASTVRDGVVRDAREALQIRKTRIAEAFDKESKKQCQHEAKAEQIIQEQRVIKAADDRVKAILKAGETCKRQMVEAVENRKRAIRQIIEDERQTKLIAKEAAKQQRKFSRKASSEERTAVRVLDNEAARVETGDRKSWSAGHGASETSGGEVDFSFKHNAANPAKPDVLETVTEKNAEIQFQQSTEQEPRKNRKLTEQNNLEAKRAKQDAEETAKKQKEQEALNKNQMAEENKLEAKRAKQDAEETAKKQREATRDAGKAERKAAKIAKHGVSEAKIKTRQSEDFIAEPVGKGTSVKRSGNIKLIISNDSSDATHIDNFIKSLSEIPGIKIVMVSGGIQEGTQVVVASESPVALSEELRQLSIVQDVVDRHSDIMIRLSSLVVFKNI